MVFEISGDNRPVQQTLRDTTSTIEKESKKWDRAVDESSQNVRKSMSQAFDIERVKNWGIAAAKALGQFVGEAINAASELQEVQNVVDVTFGDSSSAIDSWAKNAISQFGMSETMAKRFASTMGAMMKSAGLAGPEIVEMSEELSGLAADMASFYNLDYETAFAKIRSGISGETEPLKQLGINMSVANLEAYALTQGITKSFDKMSQSEQVQLRYQYLMQATADAQGDFARTSDGYANSVRLLDQQITQIKATMGSWLIDVVTPLISGLNNFLSIFTGGTKTRTVLDDFADINAETQKKLAEINATAEEVNALIDMMEQMSGKSMSATGLTEFVTTLSTQFSGLDDAVKEAKDGDYAGTISAVAQALSTDLGGSPQDWEDLLSAIGNNLGSANKELKESGDTSAFLESAAEAANSLGGSAPALWNSLVEVLGSDAAATMVSSFADASAGAAALDAFAKGANTLKSESSGYWTAFLSAVQSADGLTDIFGDADGAAENIERLAGALSGATVGSNKAEAWGELLGIFTENVDGIAALRGESTEDTYEWLGNLAEEANKLVPENAAGWEKLWNVLVGGLGNLGETEEGQTFLEAMEKTASGFDTYGAYLNAMGIETEGITDTQTAWLSVVQKLIKTIPGLADIINAETGEVQGGSEALKKYVDDYKASQEALILWEAYYKKKAAYESQYDTSELRLAMMGAEYNVKQLRAQLENAPANEKFMVQSKLAGAEMQLAIATGQYNNAVNDAAEAAKILANEEAALTEMYGEQAAAAMEAAAATEEWSDDVKAAATTAYSALVDASEALANYYKSAWNETRQGVDQTVKGLESIVTPARQAREEMTKLELANKKFAEDNTYSSEYAKAQDSLPTYSKIADALQSQLDFVNEYQQAMSTAREMGMDEGLLAMLSDGSAESLDYLNALIEGVNMEGRDIEKINEMYRSVQDAKDGFTDTLTENKLKVDDEFADLQSKLESTIADLNQYDIARDNIAQTVQGIADGIAEKIGPVQEQVDRLNAALSSLQGIGGLGFFGGKISYYSGMIGGFLNGSHESGLDYVPFDNYLARLHEGESILTAEEAKVWREFRYGQSTAANSIDYGALGTAMWENAPSLGGNVYLDGQTVGRVISAQQANSYRALQRSGWQQ